MSRLIRIRGCCTDGNVKVMASNVTEGDLVDASMPFQIWMCN